MYNDYSEEKCWHLLETALKKLKTDYIDSYLTHSLHWQDYMKFNNTFLKFTRRAIDKGLVRHRGFSSHETPENIKKFIETGEFSAMTVQYNILNRVNEEVIALAHEKGMGVVVMGPVAGGMLGDPEEEMLKLSPVKASNTAGLALKFVFANSNVHVAISGMSAMRHVQENLATANDASQFSHQDIERLNEVFESRKKLLELYCTGCQYCMPCPHKVKIPDIFRYYNNARVYGLNRIAKQGYLSLNIEERADACQECGECEKKCPQKIAIREKLKEASGYFGKTATTI
jgi:predicted aldo/keto reductase-like oxidoreductase